MASRIRSAAFFLALLPAIAAGQDTPTTGSVDGVVVNGITGEPMAHVRVTLTRPSRGSSTPTKGYGAITGDDGKFAWSSVEPYGYNLTVEMRGFIESDTPGGVFVGTGGVTHDLKLQLVPEAVLTGRVLDSDGEPVEGAKVLLVFGRTDDSATTDDRGEFRFTGLRARKYLVRAEPPPVAGPAEIRTDGTKEECHAPTWYPGTLAKSEAAPVEVTAGAHVSGIEIRLARIPILRVSGTVTGGTARQLTVNASNADGSAAGGSVVRDGKFAIWRLPPGKYQILALGTTPDGEQQQSYPILIDLAQADVDNLTLDVIPAFEVAGQVEWDGTPPPADQRKDTWIHLAWQAHGPIAPDGSFRIPHVNVGKGPVQVTGMPANVFVQSIRLGSDEMPDREFDLHNDPKGTRITVVLSAAGAEISGVVRSGDKPVPKVLVCAAPDRENARCESAVGSSADGAFTVHGLAPGRYKIYVVDSDSQDPGANPIEVVAVQEGEKATRDLTVADRVR
jgi:hypothetical protein